MADTPEVQPDAATELVDGGAFLLDVREQDEWDAGHAPGAHHIPLGELNARHTELPTDRQVVAVCRSGKRSAAATDALNGAGYQVLNLAGGMQAWQASGKPVVTDAGATGTVI